MISVLFFKKNKTEIAAPANQDNDSAGLLPSGFADLLPAEAEREFNAIAVLMKVFSSLGYARVKPPLVEFEESLFAFGPGASLINNTFRLMDPLSHRMMGIRSDITSQIARIALSRLSNAARPLRLTYANDALRTRGSQQRTERQFCQAGCEIIGPDDPQKDIEACVAALMGLKALNIERITIDLGYPHLAAQILEHYKISDQDKENLEQIIKRRDRGALEKSALKPAEIFKNLLEANGDLLQFNQAMKKISLPPGARESLRRLEEIAAGLDRAIRQLGFDDIAMTIDPLETRGFHYKTGFAFTLFARDVPGVLGRGGRYVIEFAARRENATGFTLYLDTVARAAPPCEVAEYIYIPLQESWAVVKDLQAQGRKIIRGENAERAFCTHEYKNGQITRI